MTTPSWPRRPAASPRLARTNATLMMRNRLTLAYAVVVPLLPLGLLFIGERGDVDAGGSTRSAPALLMALMFPVYYNLLSMFVSRRDELVLKRLRTGEVRDRELVRLDGAARASRSPWS